MNKWFGFFLQVLFFFWENLQKFLAYSKSRMDMKKRGFIAECQTKSTLSPREDNSVAAFTMHPSTRTTRTCREREASTGRRRKNRKKEKRERKRREKKICVSREAFGWVCRNVLGSEDTGRSVYCGRMRVCVSVFRWETVGGRCLGVCFLFGLFSRRAVGRWKPGGEAHFTILPLKGAHPPAKPALQTTSLQIAYKTYGQGRKGRQKKRKKRRGRGTSDIPGHHRISTQTSKTGRIILHSLPCHILHRSPDSQGSGLRVNGAYG